VCPAYHLTRAYRQPRSLCNVRRLLLRLWWQSAGEYAFRYGLVGSIHKAKVSVAIFEVTNRHGVFPL